MLRITTTSEPGGTLIAVDGELDLATVGDLRVATTAAAAHGGTLVLDLSAVTFMDSTGLSALLALDGASRTDGFALEVVAGEAVRRVLDLCGVLELLPLREPR